MARLDKSPIPWSTVTGVYVVDLSYIHELYLLIRSGYAGRIDWVDHHTSTKRRMMDLTYPRDDADLHMTFSQDACGALLTHRLLFGVTAKTPEILRVVDAYDRWIGRSPFYRALIIWYMAKQELTIVDVLALWETKFTKPSLGLQWEAIMGGADVYTATIEHMQTTVGTKRGWLKVGDEIPSSQDEIPSSQGEVVTNSTEGRIFSIRVEALDRLSELLMGILKSGDQYAAQNAESLSPTPQIAIWVRYRRGRNMTVSLRTLDGVEDDPQRDMSMIAERYGGGGHVNAASFNCTIDEFNALWLPTLKVAARSD